MDNICVYVLIALLVVFVFLIFWIRHLLRKGKQELVYTKNDLNETIKYLESEINKIKQEITKS